MEIGKMEILYRVMFSCSRMSLNGDLKLTKGFFNKGVISAVQQQVIERLSMTLTADGKWQR